MDAKMIETVPPWKLLRKIHCSQTEYLGIWKLAGVPPSLLMNYRLESAVRVTTKYINRMETTGTQKDCKGLKMVR